MARICGIIALMGCIFSFIGWIFLWVQLFTSLYYQLSITVFLPLASIISGIIGIKVDEPKRLAHIGLVIGILEILILPVLIRI